MGLKEHWEAIHSTKASDYSLSWYRPNLEMSLALIDRTGAGTLASIIDVGGGQSTLVDDLFARGYRELTILDISANALEAAKKRLGENAVCIRWITADITQAALPEHTYDIWHDRAVFHFLTSEVDRATYVRQAARSLKLGGHLILVTFAANGPARCSGLEVIRYTAESLAQEMGEHFRLIESVDELHHTPNGVEQPFVHARFQAV